MKNTHYYFTHSLWCVVFTVVFFLNFVNKIPIYLYTYIKGVVGWGYHLILVYKIPTQEIEEIFYFLQKNKLFQMHH